MIRPGRILPRPKRNTAMTSNFDKNARFPSIDAAFAAIEGAGLNKGHFKVSPDQGEFILIDIAPKAAPVAAKPAKAAKGKGKGKAAKPAKKGLAARIEAQGDLKAAPKAPAKDYGDSWRPLDARKWIGPWADYKAKAEKGQLPDIGGSKLSGEELRECNFYGRNSQGESIFHALTHRPFEKRLLALCALIRAKDIAGLKKHSIREISTTPNMLAKLRDLAIAALAAKEAKPAKAKAAKGAKAAPAAEAQEGAPQA